jgi:hypothetical protein
MCRNIRMLFNFEPPASDEEIRAAAVQYVRKVTGATRPAKANTAAFDRAIDEIEAITRRLVRDDLIVLGPVRSREVEAEKAKVRGQKREERVRVKVLGEQAGGT